MKSNYQSSQLIISIIFLIFLIDVYLLFYLISRDINRYKLIEGVVSSDNIVDIFINNNDLKLFRKNKKLYINNKSLSFKVIEVDKSVLKKKKQNYNYVRIKINRNNKYKSGDVVVMTIFDTKERLINIFKTCWKE